MSKYQDIIARSLGKTRWTKEVIITYFWNDYYLFKCEHIMLLTWKDHKVCIVNLFGTSEEKSSLNMAQNLSAKVKDKNINLTIKTEIN